MSWIRSRAPLAALALSAALLASSAAVPTSAEAGSYCVQRSYEDLWISGISCRKGKKVYRYSQRECSGSPCRIRYLGRDWKCRAKNTSIYTWRCTSGSKVVRYRWLSGE